MSNKACFHLGDNLLRRVLQSRDANLVCFLFLFRCCVSVFLKPPSHSCVCTFCKMPGSSPQSVGFHSAVGDACTELVKAVERERE